MKTTEQANPPIWKDGDVIAYTFKKADGTAEEKEYSYARMDGYWPGEREWSSLSDEDVTDAWCEGRAYLLRSGVEEARLPESVAKEALQALWEAESELRIAHQRIEWVRDILEDAEVDRPFGDYERQLRAAIGPEGG